MTNLQKCGFCELFTGFLRRAMCVGNRRRSSESFYRELGDQDTLRFEDQVSQRSIESSPSEIVDFSVSAENGDFEPHTFRENVNVLYKEGVGDMVFEAKTPTERFSSPQRRRRKRSFPMPHILEDYYPCLVRPMLARAGSWDYDTTLLDYASGGRCLPVLCMHLFEKHGLMKQFDLSPESCWKLFVSIEESYVNTNPYHNAVHAADVTQAINCFLLQQSLSEHMKPIEVLVALLAAITHDVDHPGVNIHFLMATEHPLTVIYKDQALTATEFQANLPFIKKGAKRVEKFMLQLANTNAAITEQGVGVCKRQEFKGEKAGSNTLKIGKDAVPDKLPSVLEHHHWRTAYSCILQSKVFDHMKNQLPKIRTMLKSLILSTDITRQNYYINKFKVLIDRKKLDMTKTEHRHLVLQMALKTADISNPGRPWRISRAWSQRVCDEFFAQGDEERRRKLPITNLCDRENDTIANIQTGFFTYVVLPLFRQWQKFTDDDISTKMLGYLRNNQHNWEAIIMGHTLDSYSASVVSSTFISSADVVTRNIDSSTGSCYSVNMSLYHSRRCSLSPEKPSRLREAFRRFSEPLGTFVTREPGSRARSKRDSIPEYKLREELSPVHIPGALPKVVREIVSQESNPSGSKVAPLIDVNSPAPRQQVTLTPVYGEDSGSFSGFSRDGIEEVSFDRLQCTTSASLKSSLSDSLPSNVSHLRRLLNDTPQTNSLNGKASELDFDMAWAGARAGDNSLAWTMANANTKGRRGSAPVTGATTSWTTLPSSFSMYYVLTSPSRRCQQVYSENVFELLNTTRTPLPLREDNHCGVMVAGLSLHQITTAEQMLQMLENGNKSRTSAP